MLSGYDYPAAFDPFDPRLEPIPHASPQPQSRPEIITKASSDQPGIIIPLYVYPENLNNNPAYTTIIDLLNEYDDVPIYCIINPHNGPGNTRDRNYQAAIKKLKKAGAKILAYVSTAYTQRTTTNVCEEIDHWLKLYPNIDGLFFDEMTNTDVAASINYYVSITRYAHDKKLFPIVANPGAGAPDAYFSSLTADYITIHETAGYPASSNNPDKSAKVEAVDIQPRKSALIYSADFDPAQIKTLSGYCGLIYVTNDSFPDPWDTVSPYLGSLCQVLSPGTNMALRPSGKTLTRL